MVANLQWNKSKVLYFYDIILLNKSSLQCTGYSNGLKLFKMFLIHLTIFCSFKKGMLLLNIV